MLVICAVRPKIKRGVIAVLGVIAAIAVAVIVYFNFKGQVVFTLADTQYSVQAGENEQRIAFLQQFGWQVNQQPVSVEEISIPEQFNAVYERYNELQKTQGMDLSKYAGKTVKKAVYQITNYSRQDTVVYATLLIYRDKVIGGDVSCAELNGFMYGFAGQGETTTDLPESNSEQGVEEAMEQIRGEFPPQAYPTD